VCESKGEDKGEETVSEGVLARCQAHTWQACHSMMQTLGMGEVGRRARAWETETVRVRKERERKRKRKKHEGMGEDEGGGRG
jgi:hypothetical protein